MWHFGIERHTRRKLIMKILIFSLACMFTFGECRVICSLLVESGFLLLDFGSFSQIISKTYKKEKRIWKIGKRDSFCCREGSLFPFLFNFYLLCPRKVIPLLGHGLGEGFPQSLEQGLLLNKLVPRERSEEKRWWGKAGLCGIVISSSQFPPYSPMTTTSL